MFEVLNNKKPATLNAEGWRNNKFETKEEALTYMDNYLGEYSPGIALLDKLPLGEEYDYTGYNDTMSIVETGE